MTSNHHRILFLINMKSLNIMGHKANLSIFKRFQIFQNMFSNHSTIMEEINMETINSSNVWKLIVFQVT